VAEITSVFLKPGLMLAMGLIIVSMGCTPFVIVASPLPTALPGVLIDNGEMHTPTSRAPRIVNGEGPTSTPAPWATRVPPTAVPNRAHPVSHDLKGKSDCLYCHRGPTYYRVPADHATRTNQSCLGCHSPSSSPPKAVPHPLAGREGCLICHLTGKNGARAIPGDHSGRLNDTCATCHLIR
jgi:hypothetical protein